ncbi:MAG: hypothetical protein O9284_02890 [Steroidobacteraceae bacterium]|jgi:hypothetical protein|nr:hypothetical protein [Steroidobacteraceae bacterium]
MKTSVMAALGCAAVVATIALAFPPEGAKPAGSAGATAQTAAGAGPGAVANPHGGANPHGTDDPHAGAHGLPAMPPGKQAPAAPRMPITASGGDRVVWSCNVGKLGSTPVMVNFKDRTALSTRGSKISQAAIAGDMVRWQENEKDGVYAFALNSQTKAIKVAFTDLKGKVSTYEGNCGAPDPNRRTGKAPH